MWKLKRTVQCSKCPFKRCVNPFDIPDGYSIERHKDLQNTIATDKSPISNTIQVMACHNSTSNNMQHCIGWLHNQLGVGNNIALRLHVRSCENIGDMQIVGEQYDKFEDTIPTCSID